VESLISFSISTGFVIVSACIGRLISAFTRSDKASASERVLIDTSVGLGVVSIVLFALSACQVLRVTWGVSAAVIFVALGSIKLPGVLSDVAHLVRQSLKRSDRSVLSWLTIALLAILAVSALIPALAPPSMADWDSLAYHLAVPKMYLEHGGFYYINFVSHSNFPYLMEMLYLPGLALNQPAASKMMHYWTGVLLVMAIVVLVRSHLNAKAAPIAAIAVAGMPIVLWEATTAYVDLATALYTVLAVHLLLTYFDTYDRRHLIGCGFAAGFAASTKMTGLTVILLIVVWLILERLAAERTFPWRSALTLLGVSLLVCSPWYVKSAVYTGNPVYPFFYSIFDGKDWTRQLAETYAMLQQRFGTGHTPASFLMLPFDLTFRPDAFYDTPGLYVGPLFLISLPLLALGKYRSRKHLGLLLFFLAQLAIWFRLSQQSRYLIPAFAILGILASELINSDDRFPIAKRVFIGAVIVTAFFGILTMIPPVMETAPFVFGRESHTGYLLRTLDIYDAQSFINRHLPKNAKVALFGDTRGFYLKRNYVWADAGHNIAFTRDYKSPEDLVRNLKTYGVTHAMINFRFLSPPRTANKNARILYQALQKGLLVKVYPYYDDDSNVAVYKVK